MNIAHSTSMEFRLVRRAQIICLTSQGVALKDIEEAGYGQTRTIRIWVDRYVQTPGIDSLKDKPRPGRPPVYDGPIKQKVIAFVCQYPDEWGLTGLTNWSLREVEKFMPQFIGDGFDMSYETIRRILNSSALQPHRVRYYLNRTDPDFVAKALDVIRLYEQQRKNPDSFDLLCIDELSGIQALQRKYPNLPMLPGKVERREFEYIRHGTRCLIAAYDAGNGYVYGNVYPDRKGSTFLGFLNELVIWRSDKELHIVMDNLNTHKGPTIDDWVKCQNGRVFIHYTPFHGSWLNMIEIWFGILKKKCIARGNFESCLELDAKIMNYIYLWDYFFAHPFNWTFTEKRFIEWYEKQCEELQTAVLPIVA